MASYRYLLILLPVLALSGCGDGNNSLSACAASGVLLPDVSLSIDGTGFFMLSTGTDLRYSRKGDFCVAQDGSLINGLGYRVRAYAPVPGGGFNQGQLTDLVLPLTNPSGGSLSDTVVDADGVLEAVYTVGDNLVLAKLALATFPSTQNLAAEAGGVCLETAASGVARRGEAGRAEFGTIQPGLQGPFACEQGRFDLRVAGNGYFRLNDSGTTHYDASIVLGTDSLGNFVDDHGYRVSGYAADASGTVLPALVDLTIADVRILAPVATSGVELDANLDAGSGPSAVAPLDVNDPLSYSSRAEVTVFDSLGVAHPAAFYFVRATTADTWDLYLYVDDALVHAGGNSCQSLTFAGGALSSAGLIIYDPLVLGNGADDLAIELATTGLTQTSDPFAITAVVQDGYGEGVMTATHISANGEIRLDYSNGLSGILLGQLLLAGFPAPGALHRSADGETYLETVGSGAPAVDVPGAPGLGEVSVVAR